MKVDVRRRERGGEGGREGGRGREGERERERDGIYLGTKTISRD